MKQIKYRGQVIELRRVPGSKRLWEGTIYWDHDRRPQPLGQPRSFRQAKRYAKDLVNIFLDGVSLMNEIPLMLAEMGRDFEIRELEDGSLQWELELQEEQADGR